MADQDELFYRPDIKAPKRETDHAPDSVVKDRAYKSKISDDIGILPEDRPDPLTAYQRKFEEYEEIALEIKKRATFLLDKTIEGLDLYVGDAPRHVLELITDLTDIHFTDDYGKLLPPTDPAYTLPTNVAKCIFRVAGAYNPKQNEKDTLASAKEFDSDAFKKKVKDDLTKKSYTDKLIYGLKLLQIVMKLSFVIAVHYTVGWMCGYFKGRINFNIKVKIPKPVDKTIKIFKKCVGDWIANEVIGPVEESLLAIVGYKCSQPGASIPKCNTEGWKYVDFKQVNCCTMQPISFGGSPATASEFMQVSCFDKWIREELDPEYTGVRTICTYTSANDEEIEPTDYEKASASVVSQFLESLPPIHTPGASGSTGVYGINDRAQYTTGTPKVNAVGGENIKLLSKTIEAADVGIAMTQSTNSAIHNNRQYWYTGESTDPLDCFGLEDQDQRTPEERMMAAINEAAGQWLPRNNGVPIEGNSFFEFMEIADSVLATILGQADRLVSFVSNLARWGSSKQLCCFVYLIVAMVSIWRALVRKGVWCPDMEDGEAVRNEMHARWANELRNNEDLQQFVQMLKVIKQIVDIFINKMNRQIMISGLTLPLGEMWEMIKLTISNGLSEFMDILFGPLDKLMAGLQTIPEMRHMMNNQCFGFDQFLSFLMCLLGNLKWGIINQIMKVLDFTLPDLVVLQDIVLTRMRLKSLEALSDLLGSMIDLILGLKDCYDPEILVNQIVEMQVQTEYVHVQNLVSLAGNRENLEKFDEYSVPIMSETGDAVTFTPDEQATLDTLQGGIARQFGEFGAAAKEIVDNVIATPSLTVSKLVNEETGEMVGIGEFTTIMEEMTGVSVSEIQESMRYIFDILRGQNDEDVR